jgi:uncharacterized damage-inducible protein DinB
MRRSILILLAAAAPLGAQQQQAAVNTSTVANAKSLFAMSHRNVLRAAEQVPDSLYSFKPTPEVRSFGEIVGHVADAERMFCAAATGTQATGLGAEKKTSKAEIVQALKDAGTSCDAAYAQSDADANAPVSLFGMSGSRLWVLNFNSAHVMEHYGNLVTYMRIKGMVPPSSQ